MLPTSFSHSRGSAKGEKSIYSLLAGSLGVIITPGECPLPRPTKALTRGAGPWATERAPSISVPSIAHSMPPWPGSQESISSSERSSVIQPDDFRGKATFQVFTRSKIGTLLCPLENKERPPQQKSSKQATPLLRITRPSETGQLVPTIVQSRQKGLIKKPPGTQFIPRKMFRSLHILRCDDVTSLKEPW